MIKYKITTVIVLFLFIFITASAQNLSKVGYLNHFDLQTDINVAGIAAPTFADIDGDGHSDLYVGNDAGDIIMYLNTGNALFDTVGYILQTTYQNFSPAFADIDADGDLDIFAGNYNGTILSYENDGNGNYSYQGRLQSDGSDIDIGTYSKPFFRDADNDGDMDLYIGSDKLYFYTNNSGVFTFSGNVQANGTDIAYPRKTEFADIDNDGDLDIYAEYYSYLYLYSNNGSGVYSATGRVKSDGVDINNGTYDSANIFDFDEDGDLDILIGKQNGTIELHMNTGAGVFKNAGNITHSEIIDYERTRPEFADVDGNGDNDLYIGIGTTRYISEYLNSGGHQFSFSEYISPQSINNYAEALYIDRDKDGDLDIMIGGEQGKLRYYSNDGTGTFTFVEIVQDASINFNLDIGDFASPAFMNDNSGNPDLYIGNEAGEIWFCTYSGGNYTKVGRLQAGGVNIDVGDYASPAFADMDGDGDKDLYVGNQSGTVYSYINNGSGTFTSGGLLQADGTDIDLGFYSSPFFANGFFYIGSNTPDGIAYYKYDDIYPPVSDLFSLSNVYGDCSGVTPTTPKATDNVSGTVSGISDVSFPITNPGTTVVTWTYTDLAGNELTQTQNVIIQDNTAPVADVSSLSDLTGECFVSAPTSPTATVNCAGTVTGSSNVTFPVTTSGTTLVTWTYDDGNGNTSTQMQNVIINDVTAPVANVSNLSDLTEECSVSTPTSPTATDNCAGTVTGSPNVIFPVTTSGTTLVTWTYDDGNGNTSTQMQNVIIDDVTDPEITCVENQTINLATGETLYTVSGTEFNPEFVSDNCGISDIVNDLNSSSTLAGEELPLGTTTIIWDLIDNAGNSSECSFDITVNASSAVNGLAEEKVLIFPNPTKSFVNIMLDIKSVRYLSVSDISGKVLQEHYGINTRIIDLTDFTDGLYIINIQTSEAHFTTKLVKY